LLNNELAYDISIVISCQGAKIKLVAVRACSHLAYLLVLQKNALLLHKKLFLRLPLAVVLSVLKKLSEKLK
jgi:hypothetical protein